MHPITQLEQVVERLERRLMAVRRLCFGCIGVLVVIVSAGAAAGTQLRGDVSVSGVLKCLGLKIDGPLDIAKSAHVMGDLELGGQLKVMGVDGGWIDVRKKMKALDKLRERVNSRTETRWVWKPVMPTRDEGADFDVDFGPGVVVEMATAGLCSVNLAFENNEHRSIQRLHIGVHTEPAEGSKVKGHYWASMHDRDNHWAVGDMSLLIFAQVRLLDDKDDVDDKLRN